MTRTTRQILDGSDGKGPLREIVSWYREGGWNEDRITCALLECGHEKLYHGSPKLGQRARCPACAAGKPVEDAHNTKRRYELLGVRE